MRILILMLIFTSVGAFSAPVRDPLKDFFKGKTKIENPFDLRDPFKAPSIKGEKDKQKSGYTITGKGQYTNIKEAEVPSADNLRVVGVLIGKERRAIISGKGGIVIVKEGMKIGDKAELKAILPGGIILVEKITNVYGQDEYLETVVPISK